MPREVQGTVGWFPGLGPQSQVQGRETAGVAQPDQSQQLHSMLCNSVSFCLALWLCCSAAEMQKVVLKLL